MDSFLISEELRKVENFLLNYQSPKQYWMIRTQGGDLYDSFRQLNFVGIDHDQFNLTELANLKTKYGKDSNGLLRELKNQLSEILSKRFDNEDRPATFGPGIVASQIFKFFFEMKKGDIVMIPSYRSQLVSFGEIVEDGPLTFTEQEMITYAEDFTITVLARKVKWIKEIPRDKLDPYLFKLFLVQQAIINVTTYARIIERSVSNFFVVKNQGHLILDAQSPTVKFHDFFALGYLISDLVEEFNATYNLNLPLYDLEVGVTIDSPGKIDVKSKHIRNVLITGIIVVFIVGGTVKSEFINLHSGGLPELIKAVDTFLNNSQKRELKEKIVNKAIDSLQIKTPEDLNKVLETLK